MATKTRQKPPTMRIKRGDTVRVISGKHKGSEGEVMVVLPDTSRVVVKDVNVIRKTQRPTQDNPRGGHQEREAAIHASNVQLVDPQSGEPSRVAYKLEDGKKYRVSVKSGTRLDD